MFVLIVDDEALARERLASLLMRSGRVKKILRAESCEQALGLLQRNTVDAVFLDISMPGRTGVSMASEEDLPPVVFVTAHEQHAVRAFDIAAVDYLLKPLSLKRLLVALDRVQARTAALPVDAGPPVRVTGVRNHVCVTIDASKVTRFFLSEGRTMFLHGGKEYIARDPIATLAEKLAPHHFLRINRTEVVNLRIIARANRSEGTTTVFFQDGQVAVASRRGARELRKYLPF